MLKLILSVLLFLFLVSVVSGGEIASFDDILQPTSLHVVDGRIYILDQDKVNIFSLNNFKLIRKLGSRGEGPGQLLGKCALTVNTQKIAMFSLIKIVIFSTEGKLLNEKRFKYMFGDLQLLRNNCVFKAVSKEKNGTFSEFFLLDENLEIEKTLYKHKIPGGLFPKAGMGKKAIRLITPTVFARTNDENIFVVNNYNGFSIEILNIKGERVRKIANKIARVRIPESVKNKKVSDFLKKYDPAQINKIKKLFEFQFPLYFPPIQNLQVTRRQLLIQTYSELNNKTVYYKTGDDGKHFKRVLLPFKDAGLSSFSGDTVYYLIENPKTEIWELHKEAI